MINYASFAELVSHEEWKILLKMRIWMYFQAFAILIEDNSFGAKRGMFKNTNRLKSENNVLIICSVCAFVPAQVYEIVFVLRWWKLSKKEEIYGFEMCNVQQLNRLAEIGEIEK